MPQPNQPFRWTFRAYLEDGTVIDQGDNDHSPDSNQFKLVLDRIDEVRSFELIRAETQESAGVDLVTGNFHVNGTPICIHNQFFEPTKYKLELVYFREKREQITQNVQGETLDEQSFVNRYFIGWKTTVNGKNKQVTLAVG